MLTIAVTDSGPVFDGRAARAAQAATLAAVDAIAQHGHDALENRFAAVFHQHTGAYESRVVVDRTAGLTDLISDHGVVYGPWLEGTSRRNETTRFPGYHLFRLVTQQLDAQAVELAERAIGPYVREMQ